MIPLTYFCQVIIIETSKKLDYPLTLGEFLRHIHIWLLMSTLDENCRNCFWSLERIDLFDGAPFWSQHHVGSGRLYWMLSQSRSTSERCISICLYHNQEAKILAERDHWWCDSVKGMMNKSVGAADVLPRRKKCKIQHICTKRCWLCQNVHVYIWGGGTQNPPKSGSCFTHESEGFKN